MGDPPETVEFIIAELCKFVNGMSAKVIGRDVGFHGLVRNRFCPVFAKFEDGAVFRIWPSATRAIKPFVLVDHSKRFDGFSRTHFTNAMGERGRYSRYAGGLGLGFLEFQRDPVGRGSCA